MQSRHPRCSLVRFSIASLLLLTAVLGARPSSAYCVRTFQNAPGHPTWSGAAPYAVSDAVTDPKQRAAIDAAFAAWGTVSCSTLSFTKGGTFPAASTAFDKHGDGIYVFWYSSSAGWPSSSLDVPALSLILVDGDGQIVQASIAINAFKYTWGTDGGAQAFDVQAQLTSLIGLVVGLGTSNTADSVMTSTLQYGDTTKRALTDDDQAAVRYLYPQAGCSAPTAPGADGCASVAAGTSQPPAPSAPPPSPSGGGDPGVGCQASTECAGDQVCTAEGTCVLSDGQGSGGSCTSYIECLGGEVCTAEGTCVAVGASGSGAPAEPAPAEPAPTPAPAPAPPAGAPPAPPTSPAGEGGQPLSGGGCSSSAECGGGEICTAEGLCLPAAVDAGGGGGCALSGRDRVPSTLPAVTLALLGLLGLGRCKKR